MARRRGGRSSPLLTPRAVRWVAAVCIPWADAHVRTGRAASRRWEEHCEFLDLLSPAAARLLRSPAALIAGDFNQTLPRSRAPVDVHRHLRATLDGWDVVTAGLLPPAPRLIDHVAVNKGLRVEGPISFLPKLDLTDHNGVVIDLVRT